MTGSTDLVIIGGGLGGLSAAAMAAKAGLSVVVLEKATEPGGRAATTEKRGFAWNLGAHALYRGGPACAALDALGVAYPGKTPPVSGGHALRKRKRLAYVGPWLPSPIEADEPLPSFEIAGEGGTEGRYDLLESVSFAFLLALEALTPQRRAAT